MRIVSQKVASSDGTEASLTGYVIDNSPEMHMDRVRPTVLVIPGGGYEMTSDREADPIALKLIGDGYNAFVLRYTCAPARYPVALEQAAASVRLLRERAGEWNIDPHSIVVAGFSAGGHVAASLATLWNKPALWNESALWNKPELWGSAAPTSDADQRLIRPDGLFLAYPVITSGEFAHRGSFDNLLGSKNMDEEALHAVSLEFQVDAQTPPTFIWHTVTDDVVPVENSVLFTLALKNHGVAVETHLFQRGGHGLSLGTAETSIPNGYGDEESVQSWPRLFSAWLRRNFAEQQ